jgi:hypothetical protein
MRWRNDVELLGQTREERQRALGAIAPMQEEQGSPCPLADDWQVDTLYSDGVDARLHCWPLLYVTWDIATVRRVS